MRPSTKRARTPIETAAIRGRLVEAQRPLDPAVALARARAVLAERARLLARPPPAARRAGEAFEVMTFALANERYGIEVRYLQEVVRLVDLTPVPGTPDFIVGVVNLRGEILPVVDLRKFFGIQARGLTDLSRLIVLGSERAEVGVLADAVDEIVTLGAEEIIAPSAAVAGVGRVYLRGVTKEALLVLDAAVLLADDRLFVNDADPSAGGRGDRGITG